MNNSKIENTCLIIQGYPYSEEQMIKDIITYKDCGIKNFVISTYKSKVPNIEKELNKYDINYKILYNDDIGSIKKVDQNNVTFSYNENEIIPGLYIEHWDWLNTDNYWAEKATFKQFTTTRRGINIANEYFTNCSHYFVLRGDMTINNLSYLIDKWKDIDFSIEDEIAKEKIIVKYAKEHEPIHNIVSYFFYGNKFDIINLFFTDGFVGPVNWERGHPERLALNAYMNKINKLDLPRHIQYNKYFYHETEFDLTWEKYKLYGTW